MDPRIDRDIVPQWMDKVCLSGDNLLSALYFLADSDIRCLPTLKWEWNNYLGNRRIKTITYAEMNSPIMVLKEGSRPIAVAIKYETDTYFDHDPKKSHPAFVVKVYAFFGDLEETWRREKTPSGKPLEFRVKHWMDCREGLILEQKLNCKTSKISLNDVALWKRKVVLTDLSLKKAILKLAQVEDFRSLPEIAWKWDKKTVKFIDFDKMSAPFMRLKLQGELAAIAIKYTAEKYDDNAPKPAITFSIVKVITFTENIESSSPLVHFPKIFMVQNKLLCSEAHDINKFNEVKRDAAPSK